jgi:enoyl-CoA hydratase
VVDKDRKPRWNPATLAAVERTAVERYFEALNGQELTLDPKESDHV